MGVGTGGLCVPKGVTHARDSRQSTADVSGLNRAGFPPSGATLTHLIRKRSARTGSLRSGGERCRSLGHQRPRDMGYVIGHASGRLNDHSRSSKDLRATRSFRFARRMASAITGAVTPAKPDGIPRLRRVMWVR